MELFTLIVIIAEGLHTLFALAMVLIKPFRQWLLKNKERDEARDEASRCSLRNLITTFYYSHRMNSELRQFEYENMEKVYAAYKNLGGNSFVDKLWGEIQDWKVVE